MFHVVQVFAIAPTRVHADDVLIGWIGEFVNVELTGSAGYDLVGRVVGAAPAAVERGSVS